MSTGNDVRTNGPAELPNQPREEPASAARTQRVVRRAFAARREENRNISSFQASLNTCCECAEALVGIVMVLTLLGIVRQAMQENAARWEELGHYY